jgi:hypothetical protein
MFSGGPVHASCPDPPVPFGCRRLAPPRRPRAVLGRVQGNRARREDRDVFAGRHAETQDFSGNVEITAKIGPTSRSSRSATRDRLDHVKLDIQTSGDTVTIDANKRDGDWEHHDDNVVDTAFTIRVPKNANLDVDVFSSAVSVAGVSGRHHVHGFSSELSVTGSTGPVDAETFSGAIHVAPASWQKDQTLRARRSAATSGHAARPATGSVGSIRSAAT